MVALRPRLTGLWRQPDFLRFLAGRTFERLGNETFNLAVPLLAAVTLKAAPAQLGLLAALSSSAMLLLGLFAGAWIDRLPRRWVMIGAQVGRALLIVTIPVAAGLGQLRIEQLYVLAFVGGALRVCDDVAEQAYVPTLVPRTALVDGNSKLGLSWSATSVVGPLLAGWLIRLLSAPLALVFNVLTLVLASLCLVAIRQPEPAPAPASERRRFWREIRQGIEAVTGSPVLRALAGAGGITAFFNRFRVTLFVLYASRDLGIDAATLGTINAFEGIGLLVGSLLAAPAMARFGVGSTLVAMVFFQGCALVLVPLAAGPFLLVVALLAASSLLFRLTQQTASIADVSLRQSAVPNEVRGRTLATIRFLGLLMAPLGSLAAGTLGETLGPQQTLLIGALGVPLACIWVFLSPVYRLRELPAPTVPARAPEPSPA